MFGCAEPNTEITIILTICSRILHPREVILNNPFTSRFLPHLNNT